MASKARKRVNAALRARANREPVRQEFPRTIDELNRMMDAEDERHRRRVQRAMFPGLFVLTLPGAAPAGPATPDAAEHEARAGRDTTKGGA